MSRKRKDSTQKATGAPKPERHWLDVMLEGQNTRDPSLRIASERRRDRRNAKRLQARRRATRRGATED
ncbi:MAG: hypothetical protein U5K56_04235 [Halioglobus sp.]|nr:hypothetical protein [Halioglobus sp.]